MRIDLGAGLAALCVLASVGAALGQPRTALCDDPATHCRAQVTPSCLMRLGAAPISADTVAEAGDDCAEQFDAYRACIAKTAADCPRDRTRASEDCKGDRAQSIFASTERANDCPAYEAFLEVCPESLEAALAKAALRRLGCAAPVAGADVKKPPDLAPQDPPPTRACSDVKIRLHNATSPEALFMIELAADGLETPVRWSFYGSVGGLEAVGVGLTGSSGDLTQPTEYLHLRLDARRSRHQIRPDDLLLVRLSFLNKSANYCFEEVVPRSCVVKIENRFDSECER